MRIPNDDFVQNFKAQTEDNAPYTLQQMAQRVLDLQDACNLSGVIHSWDGDISRLWVIARAIGKGTDWLNTHPINKLYASKVHDLSCMGLSDSDSFIEASNSCETLANGNWTE